MEMDNNLNVNGREFILFSAAIAKDGKAKRRKTQHSAWCMTKPTETLLSSFSCVEKNSVLEQ